MSTNLLISSNNDLVVCKNLDKIQDIAQEKCSDFIKNLYISTGNTFSVRTEKSINDHGIITITIWSRLTNSLLSYESESFWCKIHQNVTEYPVISDN